MSVPVISAVSAPLIGERYRVPTVLYPHLESTHRVWPVLGPRHSDAEIIGFKPEHYHVDIRFLSERDLRRVMSHDRAAIPELRRELVPSEYLYPIARHAGAWPDVIPHPRIVWRVRTMKREFRPYPLKTAGWLSKLQPYYAGVTCKRMGGALRCPHKGAWIPTGDALLGEVICPQHGLRVNVADGVVCPR